MVSISVFGHVAKLAQLLSGVQQTLSCSNNHTCASHFLSDSASLSASQPNHQTIVLPVRHQGHGSLCVWNFVLDYVSLTELEVLFTHLIVYSLVSLTAQFCLAVHVFLDVPL